MLRFSPVIFAALVVSTTACFAQNIPAATFLPSTQDNLLFNPKWWPSQQKVMPSDGEFRDLFGRAVALSADGRIALVGAPGKAVGSMPRHGAAYVFAINNDTWRETAELPISGSVAGRLCGTSVALSSDGHTALVGCQGDVYVYKHMNGSWNQTTEFTVSGLRLMAGFGLSVALSADGQIALIGAPDKTVGGNNQQGAAYVFTFQNGAWSRPEQLIATNGVALSRFGWSVALSSDGHTALVGVPFNPRGHESTPGSAYVYQLSDVSWRQTARMTVPNDVTYDGFGIAVALSADGHTALVGAPAKKTLNTLSGRYLDGAVYLYTLSGGRWGQTLELTAPDDRADDHFGASVALSSDGRTVLVGLPNEGNGFGAINIYPLRAGQWTGTFWASPSNGPWNGSFGTAIARAADNGVTAVGAPGYITNPST